MMGKKDLKRLNIMLSVEQDEYIKERSEQLGLSKSATIRVLIAESMTQNQALNALDNWSDISKKIDSLNK